jgi:hypothetical protein
LQSSLLLSCSRSVSSRGDHSTVSQLRWDAARLLTPVLRKLPSPCRPCRSSHSHQRYLHGAFRFAALVLLRPIPTRIATPPKMRGFIPARPTLTSCSSPPQYDKMGEYFYTFFAYQVPTPKLPDHPISHNPLSTPSVPSHHTTPNKPIPTHHRATAITTAITTAVATAVTTAVATSHLPPIHAPRYKQQRDAPPYHSAAGSRTRLYGHGDASQRFCRSQVRGYKRCGVPGQKRCGVRGQKRCGVRGHKRCGVRGHKRCAVRG